MRAIIEAKHLRRRCQIVAAQRDPHQNRFTDGWYAVSESNTCTAPARLAPVRAIALIDYPETPDIIREVRLSEFSHASIPRPSLCPPIAGFSQ
jgi:hypothetical protein